MAMSEQLSQTFIPIVQALCVKWRWESTSFSVMSYEGKLVFARWVSEWVVWLKWSQNRSFSFLFLFLFFLTNFSTFQIGMNGFCAKLKYHDLQFVSEYKAKHCSLIYFSFSKTHGKLQRSKNAGKTCQNLPRQPAFVQATMPY